MYKQFVSYLLEHSLFRDKFLHKRNSLHNNKFIIYAKISKSQNRQQKNKNNGVEQIVLSKIFWRQIQLFSIQVFLSLFGSLWLHDFLITLISLINNDVTLTDFEKFHPTQIKNPPYTFIDFLDFSTLHSTVIRFMY